MIRTLNPHEQNKAFIFLLFIIASSFQVGTDLYLPTLPALGDAFGAENTLVQMTLSAFLGGTVIFQLIYGPLSDHYGRRRILLVGLSIAVMASFSCIWATSLEQLIFSRFLQGSGVGACSLMTRAALRDLYNVNAFAEKVSFINVGLAFVPSVGAIVGSYALLSMGWQGSFIVLTFFYAILFISVWRWLPETLVKQSNASTRIVDIGKGYWEVLSHRSFCSYSLCSGLVFAGWVAYLSSAPFLFQAELGLTAVEYAWLLLALTICIAVSSFTNGIVIQKMGVLKMTSICLTILFLSGVFFVFCAFMQSITIYTLLVGGMIYACGASFIYSNVKAGAFNVFPKKAGITAALYGGIQIGVTCLVSLLVAYLPEGDTFYLGLLFLMLSSISLVLLWKFAHFK